MPSTSRTRLTATITSPVGTYPINATVSGPPAGNYAVTVVPGTLTVTRRTPHGQRRQRNPALRHPNPTFTSTVSGALNGDTFTNTYSTPATITSPVGTYSDQRRRRRPGSLELHHHRRSWNPHDHHSIVTLNVAANNATRALRSSQSRPSPAPSPARSTATPSPSPTPPLPLPPRPSAPIPSSPTVSGAAIGNYTVTTTNGILTVTPATLTVTANNASPRLRNANPTFTGTTTGLLNGDTVTTTFTSSAVANSPVGTYPIVPTVTGVSSNYTVVTVNGTLDDHPKSLVPRHQRQQRKPPLRSTKP